MNKKNRSNIEQETSEKTKNTTKETNFDKFVETIRYIKIMTKGKEEREKK
jgi:hypothetical protein